MEDVEPSLTALRVSITIFHATAIFSTLFRLYYRLSTHRWWYEDSFAAVGLVADINSFVSVWVYTYPWTESNADGRVIAYWNLITCFTICIWSSRLSIIFSIIRLSSHMRRIRRIAILTAVAFTIFSAIILTEKIIVCARDHSWTHLRRNCNFGRSVGILQLVGDFVCDIALVTLPILLLRGVKLSRERRILIISSNNNLQTITAQLQITASLVICDLLVIVAYFHRVLKSEDLERAHDDDDLPRSDYLTTMVDFGHHSSTIYSSHAMSSLGHNDKISSLSV
ncbi:hypothetical protein K503DRAFT_462116 [Rhizopogon vinicolor AM-OR11-026]|uniref:Rhodopsin domain-containing protein n=1 Tax=Rhizopogon vinicolor AM-OR11-026 TaxID=1314800 RepID=A0A1B7NA00_9AGAM|nr:hypothetical protein K503DRAFT_462116 [Rhizopogon vinicolor AM-OR11-026]